MCAEPPTRNFGYLYLSDSSKFTEVLNMDQELQASCGAGMQMVTTVNIKTKYPFLYTDDINSGSLDLVDEGAFNAFGMVQWLRSTARINGVEYIGNEVINVSLDGSKMRSIKLQSGEQITAGTLVLPPPRFLGWRAFTCQSRLDGSTHTSSRLMNTAPRLAPDNRSDRCPSPLTWCKGLSGRLSTYRVRHCGRLNDLNFTEDA